MADARRPAPTPASVTAGHESSEMKLRPVLVSGIALALIAIFVGFAMRWVFGTLSLGARALDKPPHPLAAEREIPPKPRLQGAPPVELGEYKHKQAQELETYGWIDRNAGIVHIPIERAIELTLQKGLPAVNTKADGR